MLFRSLTITSQEKNHSLSGHTYTGRIPATDTSNMMRQVVLALPFAFLLLAGVRAEGEVKPLSDEATRGGGGGGGGYSQQYHYNSYPSHDPYGYTYAGLSFDLSTGLFLALGAIIVLLALAAVCYPLLSKNGGGGGDGWGGWSGSTYGSYRSLNLAGMSEKVLNAVEKAYELYNKNQ